MCDSDMYVLAYKTAAIQSESPSVSYHTKGTSLYFTLFLYDP